MHVYTSVGACKRVFVNVCALSVNDNITLGTTHLHIVAAAIVCFAAELVTLAGIAGVVAKNLMAALLRTCVCCSLTVNDSPREVAGMPPGAEAGSDRRVWGEETRPGTAHMTRKRLERGK